MAVITISRQFGAGGKTLGEMIAKRLGYTFYDNLLIQMIAEKAKVSTDWVKSMEGQEGGDKIMKFISGIVSGDYISRLLQDDHGYLDETVYVDVLNDIISRIGDQGNAVILGRGAQYILKDRPEVYKILLVGRKEDRIQFLETKYKLSPAKAIQTINMEDERRLNLYRSFGKQDYDDPHLYNMILNMSKVDLNMACDMVLRLIKS